MVSLRGNMYYFHGYSSDTCKMLPVYQIFENGTSLELHFDPPFEKELAQDHDLFVSNPIKTALYYRRFYTKMNWLTKIFNPGLKICSTFYAYLIQHHLRFYTTRTNVKFVPRWPSGLFWLLNEDILILSSFKEILNIERL